MNDDEKMDAQLAAWFAAPERAPDEAFVARMERVLAAERALAAARASAWRRFRGEAAAAIAIVAAFALLWRLAPDGLTLEQLPLGPAAAAVLVLFLWFGVELRPAATGR